jgi:hypothetical protein
MALALLYRYPKSEDRGEISRSADDGKKGL